MQSIHRLAFVVGLLVSCLTAAAPQQSGDAKSAWLPPDDLQLFERSIARCLRDSYRALGIDLSNDRIGRALVNDLDQYSSSLTVDDVRRAPTEQVADVSFIRCSWFSERQVVR